MDNVEVAVETHRVLEGVFESSIASTVLWICAGVFFLLCPLYSQRKVCAARIRERRWNVDIPPEPTDPVWLQTARERSRHRRDIGQTSLSTSEEEEIRQLFLVQQLSQYTLTISSKDIKSREEVQSDDDSTESFKRSAEETDVETGRCVSAVKSLDDNDDDSSLEHDCVVEFDDSSRIVSIPIAGESVLPMDRVYKKREVANGCAICLCEFDAMDQVTWSANKDCRHVFHSDCILQYMLSLGRREQRRRRRHPERSTGDPLKDIVTFDMLCPCCRQPFIEMPPEIPSLTPDSTLISSHSAEDLQTAEAALQHEVNNDSPEAIEPAVPAVRPADTSSSNQAQVETTQGEEDNT